MTPTTPNPTRRPTPDPEGRSFIEVQFPVSKLSKESYAERKANVGQTLTALGKWWGRKPLVLVRAIILGLLLPATDDPEADREVFLSLMTMDDEGMLKRLRGPIPAKTVAELLPLSERADAVTVQNGTARWTPRLPAEVRERAQHRAFLSMSYDRRIEHLKRPEQIDGPSESAWVRINAHLGTNAQSLPELVRELGERRFGHTPRVGDAFCGGGSVPFEAARIGCDAYASDLNPVAALLTWGALNIVGGGDEVVERVKAAQERVYRAMQEQVDEWGIERNEDGWVADAYLYCNEVRDPATGWWVPLAPSWVIGQGTRTIARLVPDPSIKRFQIEIHQGVTANELEQARLEGTSQGGIRCPVDRQGHWRSFAERQTTSMDQLRGRDGLRRWENDDLVPRPEDTLQERLYCIRWVNPNSGERVYRAPTEADMDRERKVLNLLRERFVDWQENGYIPSRRIEPGNKTDEPIRTRGWAYWHHLFNPRQLLTGGFFAQHARSSSPKSLAEQAGLLLSSAKLADFGSRLCRWDSSSGREEGKQTFYNQALNPLDNYCCRPLKMLKSYAVIDFNSAPKTGESLLCPMDARVVEERMDAWITDPGYGDVILYDELSEFFLAWLGVPIRVTFPSWYSDSRRALNVKGEGETFRLSLAECYSNLAQHMPDNGFQVVMFTHQDPEVWSDVGLTLWAAGLQVSAAWTIATETGSTGIRTGNYVQGTVILVLRKRKGDRRGDLSDLYPDIQAEVKNQIESMIALDDKEEPNFGDADYQLAAYAAALRVLTGYAVIDEIDVQKELRRTRARGEVSPLARLIGQAVRIASDYLVPTGLDRTIWRKLGPEERLYLKAIQVEAGGEAREGVYQELARGYGAGPHRELYASRSANRVRFKTPSELGSRDLRPASSPSSPSSPPIIGGSGGRQPGGQFSASLLRQLLFAVQLVTTDPERDPRAARTYLRQELTSYWQDRLTLADLLHFLANSAEPLPHWRPDVESARLLRDSLLNDAV